MVTDEVGPVGEVYSICRVYRPSARLLGSENVRLEAYPLGQAAGMGSDAVAKVTRSVRLA